MRVCVCVCVSPPLAINYYLHEMKPSYQFLHAEPAVDMADGCGCREEVHHAHYCKEVHHGLLLKGSIGH